MQACDRCHARKTRCDRRIPLCGACEKAGAQCLHTDKLRQRNVPRGYIDSMEKQVQQLTRENARLHLQLQRAAASSAEPTTAPRNQSPLVEADPPSAADNGRANQGTHEDNVFARELGFLSLVATGETRYLGSGCGMSLANLISSVITVPSGMSLPVEPSVSDGPIPSRPPTPPTDCHLPSLADAKPLIEAYFEHTHITFPLLHEPTFMESVDRAYSEPDYYESHPFEAFSIDMVLAIGSSTFNRLESSTKPSAHYTRAQAKTPHIMTMDGLKMLRAILLISHHAIFCNLGETSASIWHLVGIGARLCLEQGLHLEQGCLTGGVRNFSHGPDTVVLSEEMKKRCFWCLYNLDRVVSFTLGRPLIIRDEEIDVSLPSHLADAELSADYPVRLPTSPTQSPQRTPFLHLIRIRRLSGQILNIFHNSRQGLDIAIEDKKRIRRQFHEQLLAWKEDTKDIDLAHRRTNTRYLSNYLTKEWYDAVYHNAILLLYRPSTYLPLPTLVPGREDEEAELTILLNSARASIESYSALRHMRRLNHSWITLHGVFLAGVAYIYCIGRLLRDTAHDNPALDLLSIIEVTRTCSNLLVAICERWNVSRRSCDLFNKLSNAVIVDALNATSRLPRTGHDYQHPTTSSTLNHGSTQEVNNGDIVHNSPLEQGSLGTTPLLDQILDMDEFRHYASTLGRASAQESPFPAQFLLSSAHEWSFDMPFDEHDSFHSSLM